MSAITPPAEQHNRDGHPPVTFEWLACSTHPALILSVIVTADSPPWCVGDGDTIRGHLAETETAP